MVVLYRLIYDLENLGGYGIESTSRFWAAFADTSAFMFVFLAGLSRTGEMMGTLAGMPDPRPPTTREGLRSGLRRQPDRSRSHRSRLGIVRVPHTLFKCHVDRAGLTVPWSMRDLRQHRKLHLFEVRSARTTPRKTRTEKGRAFTPALLKTRRASKLS